MNRSFKPRIYTKKMPPFETVQTTYGGSDVLVKVYFADGSSQEYTHKLVLNENGGKKRIKMTIGAPLPFVPYPLPNGPTFGVEIEVAAPSKEKLVDLFENCVVDVRDSRYTHEVTPFWKIVPDSSVHCSRG